MQSSNQAIKQIAGGEIEIFAKNVKVYQTLFTDTDILPWKTRKDK